MSLFLALAGTSLLAGAWLARFLRSRKPTARHVPNAWKEATGLTARQAEDLLDWLESHGVAERQLNLRPAGDFAVRFR
jgi:hypothetical protein